MCAYKFRARDWKDGRKYTIFKIILMYSTIFSTKSPASGGGEISKHRLMKQIGKWRDIVWAWISAFLKCFLLTQ